MLSLKEFLNTDKEKHKFRLPLSFLSRLKYAFFVRFLKVLPFIDSLFVGDDGLKKYYWQIIMNYLKKELSISYYVFDSFFKSRFLQYSCNIFFTTEGSIKKVKGHGNSSTSVDEAISKSIGEFLERFSTSSPSEYEIQKIKSMRMRDIRKQVKIVRDFHDFNEEQKKTYPYVMFTDEDWFDVYPVLDLINNKKVYYPLRQIFWKAKKNKNEKVLANLTTSGCAGGFSLEQAKLSAIYEAIERDSFFCYWLTQTSPEKIITKPGQLLMLDNCKDLLAQAGYDIFLLNITTELNVPTCLCVALDKQTNGIVISAGSGKTLETAIVKAVNELKSCLGMFSKDETFDFGSPYNAFINTEVARTERLLLSVSGKYFESVKFLLAGAEVELCPSTQDQENSQNQGLEFMQIVTNLKNRGNGYENIYLHISDNKYLQDLGYFVVRIIVPKLYQLYLVEDLCMPVSERLAEFYQFKKGTGGYAVNQFPHPFP